MKIRSFQQNHGEADGHREESQKLHVHRQGHRGQHLCCHQLDFFLGRFGNSKSRFFLSGLSMVGAHYLALSMKFNI